jgi:hypothetical protein
LDYHLADEAETMNIIQGLMRARHTGRHIACQGFHRIRRHGLFASAARARNIARIRSLLTKPMVDRAPPSPAQEEPKPAFEPRCPCCGGPIIVVETFDDVRPGKPPTARRFRIDAS